MDPRARRALWVVTTGVLAARLFTLGQARGFGVVLEATVTITALSLLAWWVHVVFHELGHFVAARRQGFVVRELRLGPVGFDLVGRRVTWRWSLAGGVNSLPRGLSRLGQRLRVVACAGPLVTLLVTLVVGAWWHLQQQSLASPAGIFMVMGGLTLVTALLPGVLLPRRPDSGTDLEQIWQPRAVLAHWVNAAVVQALLDGQRLADVLRPRDWERLLPDDRDDAPVEPFELGWCLAMLDAGHVGPARTRLRSMAERFDAEAPEWLHTDTFNQLGCLAAFEGDVVTAKACLEAVRETQSNDWYQALLEACLAHAEGRDPGPCLAQWHAGLAQHPARAVALAGNEWVLARLRVG